MTLYVGLKYKGKQRAWKDMEDMEDMEGVALNRVISESTHLFHPHPCCPNQLPVSS